MIVSCPSCGKKYQIPEDRLGDGTKRIRCRNCSEVFTVTAPPADRKRGDEPQEEDSASKARRLARVLASDMVVYNRELVEKARRDGSLLEVMGAEVERSWQLWKSRFPVESVERMDIFREALDDVLAGGGDDFSDWEP